MSQLLEALLTALDVAGEVLLTAVTQLVPVELVPGHEGPAASRLVAVERFNVVMRKEVELQFVSLPVGLLTVLFRTAPELFPRPYLYSDNTTDFDTVTK